MTTSHTFRFTLMASNTTLDILKPRLDQDQVREASDAVKVLFRLNVIEGYEILQADHEEERTSPYAEAGNDTPAEGDSNLAHA